MPRPVDISATALAHLNKLQAELNDRTPEDRGRVTQKETLDALLEVGVDDRGVVTDGAMDRMVDELTADDRLPGSTR